MKDSYIKYVLIEYLQDVNFDARFPDWIDEDELKELMDETAYEAFLGYGIEVSNSYSAIVGELFSELFAANGIVKRGDEYAGLWFKLNIAKKDEITKKLQHENPAAKTLEILPDEALARALNKIVEEDNHRQLVDASENDSVKIGDDLDGEVVPASDRFVRPEDNQEKTEMISSELLELEKQIRDSNEGGALFGDDKDDVANEVGLLRSLLTQSRVRVSAATQFARSSLSWIAEKAGSAAIGDLAKRALALILDWLA